MTKHKDLLRALSPSHCHVEVCGVDQEVLQDAVAEVVAHGKATEGKAGVVDRPTTLVQNIAIKTAHVSRRR